MRKENAGFTIETENLKFSFKKATGTLLSRYASLRKQKFTGASQHLLVNLKKKPLKISNYIPSSKPPTESAKPKCSICGKTVSSTSYLQVHLRIHLQDKPFECRVCKAAFADRSNLRKHVLIHDQGRSSEDVDSPE
ncbi:zinc finger protein 728-like [Thrips palmi]|nr:zinc finger protein 728-like [Thrips palmi]